MQGTVSQFLRSELFLIIALCLLVGLCPLWIAYLRGTRI